MVRALLHPDLWSFSFLALQIRYKGGKKTPVGSFLFGGVFGIGWSACIGPILASLLLLSATTGTILKGTLLLFIYAVGLGLPLLILSVYFEKIKTKKFWRALQGRMVGKIHTTYLISGILLIIIGILIFTDFLFSLNQIALQSSFVQNVVIQGEEYLKDLFLG